MQIPSIPIDIMLLILIVSHWHHIENYFVNPPYTFNDMPMTVRDRIAMPVFWLGVFAISGLVLWLITQIPGRLILAGAIFLACSILLAGILLIFLYGTKRARNPHRELERELKKRPRALTRISILTEPGLDYSTAYVSDGHDSAEIAGPDPWRALVEAIRKLRSGSTEANIKGHNRPFIGSHA
jgi:hypothetical protein